MSILKRFASYKQASSGTQEGIWGLGSQVAKIWEKYIPVHFDKDEKLDRVESEFYNMVQQWFTTGENISIVEQLVYVQEDGRYLPIARPSEAYEIIIDAQLHNQPNAIHIENAINETTKLLYAAGLHEQGADDLLLGREEDGSITFHGHWYKEVPIGTHKTID